MEVGICMTGARALLLITLLSLPGRGAPQLPPSPERPFAPEFAPALAPEIAPPVMPRGAPPPPSAPPTSEGAPSSEPARGPPASQAIASPTGVTASPAPPPPPPAPSPPPPPACVPQCAGRACGDDGCGSSCGACAAGIACAAQGRCEGCLSGRAPTFAAHEKRRFRCLPDPVRGGHYCDVGTFEARYVDVEGCARSCGGAAGGCPIAGPRAEECRRCTAACREASAVPCTEPNGGRPAGTGCALRAGTFGLDADAVVPTTCSSRPPSDPMDGR